MTKLSTFFWVSLFTAGLLVNSVHAADKHKKHDHDGQGAEHEEHGERKKHDEHDNDRHDAKHKEHGEHKGHDDHGKKK